MSSLRPEYSFLTKAISELGTVEAPNMWWWNVFGYTLPGLMIAIFGIGLFNNVSPDGKNKFPMIGIFGSGLFMSFSGIFPGDMENMQSLTTYLHLVGSFGSYIFFLIGAFTFPKQMRKSDYWHSSSGITLTLTWATILFGAWPFIFPHMPGVGQRLVFMFYFLWIFYTAFKLFKVPFKRLQTS
jgi:hypothetical membrane protein